MPTPTVYPSHAEFPTSARGDLPYKSVDGWALIASSQLGTRFATHVPIATTTGTDVTPVSGTRYTASVVVPHTATLTGVSYLIGSVGGTDKVIVELYDSAGTLQAQSAAAGVTVGSSATIQQVPFTSTYVAEPGVYFISVSVNGTTCRLRTIVLAETLTKSATGTFGTPAALTPPTTFTTGVGPIASTY